MPLSAAPDDLSERPSGRAVFSGGLLASLAVHGLVAALLTGGVNWHMSAPGSPPIDVELVVVPDRQEPEADEPEPVTAEPEPQQSEEAPEQTQSPELAAQSAAAQAPESTEIPIPVVQAVDEFTEEPLLTEPDRSVEEAPLEERDGGESSDGSRDVGESADADEPAEKPAGELPAEPEGEAGAEPEEPEASSEADVEAAEAGDEVGDDLGVSGPIVTAALPVAKPEARRSEQREVDASAGRAAEGGAGQLLPAARILTGDVLPDSRTRAALASLPPGERLNLLCMSELRQQLNASTPPYLPDLMPSLRPRAGRVLDPGGWLAFRSFGQWYDVAFRCVTDEGIRRVEQFSFRVGDPIPSGQWNARRLPVN